jgi:hypothetical protein
VSTQDWPGEAAVDVSIVNWVKQPPEQPTTFVLDENPVEGIDTALDESTIPIADVPVIAANRGVAFQGVIPRGSGFVLRSAEAAELLEAGDAQYNDVVRPYLGGQDITTSIEQTPSRYVIDFGTMRLEQAMAYPRALQIVRERVKPARDLDEVYADNWAPLAAATRVSCGFEELGAIHRRHGHGQAHPVCVVRP